VAYFFGPPCIYMAVCTRQYSGWDQRWTWVGSFHGLGWVMYNGPMSISGWVRTRDLQSQVQCPNHYVPAVPHLALLHSFIIYCYIICYCLPYYSGVAEETKAAFSHLYCCAQLSACLHVTVRIHIKLRHCVLLSSSSLLSYL